MYFHRLGFSFAFNQWSWELANSEGIAATENASKWGSLGTSKSLSNVSKSIWECGLWILSPSLGVSDLTIRVFEALESNGHVGPSLIRVHNRSLLVTQRGMLVLDSWLAEGESGVLNTLNTLARNTIRTVLRWYSEFRRVSNWRLKCIVNLNTFWCSTFSVWVFMWYPDPTKEVGTGCRGRDQQAMRWFGKKVIPFTNGSFWYLC